MGVPPLHWIRGACFTQHLLLLVRCWVKNTSQFRFLGTIFQKGQSAMLWCVSDVISDVMVCE